MPYIKNKKVWIGKSPVVGFTAVWKWINKSSEFKTHFFLALHFSVSHLRTAGEYFLLNHMTIAACDIWYFHHPSSIPSALDTVHVKSPKWEADFHWKLKKGKNTDERGRRKIIKFSNVLQNLPSISHIGENFFRN